MTAYLMPAAFGEAELVEKRSRFIARVWPTDVEEEALAHIKEMRERHWDANHNVYAYHIRETGAMRYSDDGEPGGTSGMPTLNVFRQNGVENFCCVVTRYFGGILLGAGGLVRAYSAAAKLALSAAGIQKMDLYSRFVLTCPYARYERVSRLVSERGAVVENTEFGADVTMDVLTPEDDAPGLVLAVTDATAGAVRIEERGSRFMGVKV